MTDNEIIKALECCKKDRLNLRCRKCPLSQYADCQTRLEREIFPLVNRQRAEIEDLKETLSIFREDMHLIVERRRHEAIKECIERIKKESSSFVACHGYDHVIEETRSYQISGITLDKIKKEMVGEG